MNGIPLIDHVQITGPFDATGPGDTPSRRRIFVCRPASAEDELPCAKKILSTLARRAYRRPVTDARPGAAAELSTRPGRKQGSFDAGIENALRLILASPKFLFRAEPRSGAAWPPARVYRVSDLELASRLSFFLWSSIPDDELLNVAAQGKLTRAGGAGRSRCGACWPIQAREALVNNFAGQWLYLRNLQSVAPDEDDVPGFRRQPAAGASRSETELFFDSIMREDRSVLDLLTADYTFVNERLAQHYGIPERLRQPVPARARSPNDARRGLLGQGSILTVTSYPNRTSPVLRGKWILENILGTPPPPPPPNVPALKDQAQGGKVLSMRERMEEHRENPACATCHRVMDPLGFALENFDASRASGATKDAARADRRVGPAGRRHEGRRAGRRCAKRSAEASATTSSDTLTEKLLTYALGRGAGVLRHAGGARDRARARRATITGSRRWSWGSSRARRFR